MKLTYKTVGEVTLYIKSLIESDSSLKGIVIRGEIASLSDRTHFYFTLKDNEKHTIKAILFKGYQNGTYTPKEGDDVLAFGDVEVYPYTGQYQLIVRDIMRFGEGSRIIELEKLRKKLQAEGLFDESKKLSLPRFPKTIGVITAKSGAAVHDIYENIMIRYPIARISLFNSSVQGKNAPSELKEALNKAIDAKVDVIIIGRGGGDSDDLSAFNDEELVRLIHASPIPIISAVGHESDVTLVDYVASKRASTPTGAAVLATPNVRDLLNEISAYEEKLDQYLLNLLKQYQQKLLSLKSLPILKSPDFYFKNISKDLLAAKSQLDNQLLSKINNYQDKIKSLTHKLEYVMRNKLNNFKISLTTSSERLYRFNPMLPIERGYTLIVNEQDEVIKSIHDVTKHQIVKTILKDGRIISRIESKESN